MILLYYYILIFFYIKFLYNLSWPRISIIHTLRKASLPNQKLSHPDLFRIHPEIKSHWQKFLLYKRVPNLLGTYLRL